MNVSERNEFILNNLELMQKTCRQAVRSVLKKYHGVCREDLNGYATLGFVKALETIDMSRDDWKHFLLINSIDATLDGVKNMLGIKRCRVNKINSIVQLNITAYETNDLIQTSDRNQHIDIYEETPWLQNIMMTHEQIVFLHCLKRFTLEREVFFLLTKGFSIKQITRLLNIQERQLRKIGCKLALIHQCFIENKPYDNLYSRRVLEYSHEDIPNLTELLLKLKGNNGDSGPSSPSSIST